MNIMWHTDNDFSIVLAPDTSRSISAPIHIFKYSVQILQYSVKAYGISRCIGILTESYINELTTGPNAVNCYFSDVHETVLPLLIFIS